MKRLLLSFWFFVCSLSTLCAQQITLTATVVDSRSGEPIDGVEVALENTDLAFRTDVTGALFIEGPMIPLGEQILVLNHPGYLRKRIPIIMYKEQKLDLKRILLEPDLQELESGIGLISLSEQQLDQDQGDVYNSATLLQATRDPFQNAAAFEFSTTFFRPRGLDNGHGKVLMNGLEMNKLFNGRPRWASWGGLSDVQRNQQFSMGLKANPYDFGGLAGTSYIDMRATTFRKGGRFSVSAANRSYQGRAMATYASGLTNTNWAYAVSISGRYGTEGYVDGNPYQAISFFTALEKRLNEEHSLNFTAFYTPNARGRSTAITHEVKQLRGIRYNPNWGYQDGAIRNSRTRVVKEPVVMLNHHWTVSPNTSLNTNIGYMFGMMGTSRIDNGGTRLLQVDGQDTYLGGGRNPLPNYYQRLPSYFLRNPNPGPYHFQLAYQAQQQFLTDGQIDWPALYLANEVVVGTGGNAVYVVQEDRTDDSQLNLNTIISSELSKHVSLNARVDYRKLRSENYALLKDLLGGTGYLDVDFFAEDDVNLVVGDLAQSDLRNRNRIALLGDRYKYNYLLTAEVFNGFFQAQFAYSSIDLFMALQLGQTTYGRKGLYENGNYPGDRSFGDSAKAHFTSLGGKAGATFRVSGRHHLEANLAYFSQAPKLQSAFGNARQNNDLVLGLKQEVIQSADISYYFRSANLNAQISAYHIALRDQTDVGFYFTQNISGLGTEGDAFIQEITTGMDSRRAGLEFGLETQLTTSVKLRAAAAFGRHMHTNNPQLYITSDDFEGALSFGDGTTRLKDYYIAGGPQQAYNLALEYRDPQFWWISLSGNRFSHAYIDVNHLARTANFGTDFDGQPFNDYDEETARALLTQERFNGYYLFNAVGGKSWRLGDYYLGFFGSINNILGQHYKTGGFQQGRYANYRDMLTDQNREHGSLFGPRYFFGYGTTYYLSLYVRF